MPQMPAIKTWLQSASLKLADAGIQTNRLDAELILANVLKVDRTYLHAHYEQIINTKQYKLANRNLKLRLRRMPIAYITGQKEFYGRQFIVSKNVLIPRPESENIINVLKKLLPPTPCPLPPTNLIDIGTGSGCLGITAKLEFPNLDVTLLDISAKALKIAKINAQKLSADVTIKKSNLLKKYSQKPNIIIANLPYVNKSWQISPEVLHEPSLALFADDDGKSIIIRLITQASQSLVADGYLIIEADPCQHKQLATYAQEKGFQTISEIGYILAFKKLDVANTNTVKS